MTVAPKYATLNLTMNLASEINQKLDEIIKFKREVKGVEEDYADPNFELEDVNTGEAVTKEMVLNKASDKYNKIIDDLNTLTNNGKNCRDLFTNQYYVNNFTQDKAIAEEERQERLDKEIQKQIDSNN